MLPFRYVAELLGAQVYYDPTTGTAHCIKRDYWTVNLDGLKFGYSVPPIFSTVIGDSFADELNKWYNDPENSWGAVLLHKTSDEVKPNYFDSALGDITVEISRDIIVNVWAKSNGHMQNMLIEGKAFGFSLVDGNAYFITFK